MSLFGKPLQCWMGIIPSQFRAFWACVLVLALWVYFPAVPVIGQATQANGSGVFLPSNRTDMRGIQQAKALIAKGEFSQAVRFLDEVLAREEDSFVAGNSEEYFGLKEVVREILRDLPPEGKSIYESTFGPVSRRLLRESTKSGDFEKLRQITQRYFYTPAGYEAAMLFAQHEADKGRHLTAALTYQRLLETSAATSQFQPQLSLLAATSWLAAENPSKAAAILTDLAQQGYHKARVSGREYSLRSLLEKGPIAWLAEVVGTPLIKDLIAEHQWLMPRGNVARNGQADGGLPHFRVRWQVRLLEHHDLESIHDSMAAVYQRQEKSRLAAATPLAVGDYIITRSAHGLIAVDFNTGKRVWRTEPQQVALFEELMEQSRGEKNYNQGGYSRSGVAPTEAFARMIWEDYLYNTTSSDGQRAYVIRDLALPKFDLRHAVPIGLRNVEQNKDGVETNRLCAYDLSTQGKLVWEIDGAARGDELQGAFFLGAPVAVGQSLYCLAEIESETAIYLLSLDRQTGALQWRQQLVDLERGVRFDIDRRLQASMPSYDEGVLICPTGAGVVVGVDLAKQALAWAYRYDNGVKSLPNRRLRQLRSALQPSSRWVHSAPVIVAGRVLLTPPESKSLHCLDLVSGKLLWKQPRGKAMYLAGVEAERVLLVGDHQVSALNLSDGELAWKAGSLDLPEASTPTGSGFFSGGNYFLPLSNAEVVEIDVEQGAIKARTRSRDAQLLGNLICYQGAVISQSGRFLDCFEQVDVLRADSEKRHAEDPNDFEASRVLGEIAYNEGRLSQSIELLSQSFESNPSDLRTREVLSEALIAALDEDFAKFQTRLPLLEKIQEDSLGARLTLLRLRSQGLLEIGQAVEAFYACLDAYEILAGFEMQLSIGQDHRVDARRWLAAHVVAVWEAANKDEQEEIANEFNALQSRVSEAGDWKLSQHFYRCLGGLPLTGGFALGLADSYVQQGDLLNAQQLLISLAESQDADIQRAAIAKNSQILHDHDLPLLAAPFDLQLEGSLADQECLPGLTGLECLDQWRNVKERSGLEWPYGKVEVSTEDSATVRIPQSSRSPGSVQLERGDSVLGSCNTLLMGGASGSEREVAVRDSYGREFFRAKLDKQATRFVSARGAAYGASRGNLLVVSLGHEIVAFNTLTPDAEALWRKRTASNVLYQNRGNLANQQRPGTKRPARTQSNGNWIGVLGPITRDSCVFQIEQRLVCVDSHTGEERWSRDGLPLGCDLYGDQQYVFAMPRGKKHALIFNAIDGRSLGETPLALPIWREQLTTVGRKVIRWRERADRKFELSSLDALTGEKLWSYEFAKKSRVDVEQNRFAAVVEPTGRCVVVDVGDGSRLVDQPIEASLALDQIHLVVGMDSFLLAVQHNRRVDKARIVRALNKFDYTDPFTGQIYMFSRTTGKSVWSRPANIKGLPMMLSQPGGLPVIAFTGLVRRQNNQGSKYLLGVKLLEKSSGRLLYQDDAVAQSAQLSIEATDMKANEVVVNVPRRQIKLKFTGQPRPPEPPVMHEVLQTDGGSANGLQEIGKKLFNGG